MEEWMKGWVFLEEHQPPQLAAEWDPQRLCESPLLSIPVVVLPPCGVSELGSPGTWDFWCAAAQGGVSASDEWCGNPIDESPPAVLMGSFRTREVPGNYPGLIKPFQASPSWYSLGFKGEGEIHGEEMARRTQERFGQLRSGAASPLAAPLWVHPELEVQWVPQCCHFIVWERKFLNEHGAKVIFIITVLKDTHKILMNLLGSSWKSQTEAQLSMEDWPEWCPELDAKLSFAVTSFKITWKVSCRACSPYGRSN